MLMEPRKGVLPFRITLLGRQQIQMSSLCSVDHNAALTRLIQTSEVYLRLWQPLCSCGLIPTDSFSSRADIPRESKPHVELRHRVSRPRCGQDTLLVYQRRRRGSRRILRHLVTRERTTCELTAQSVVYAPLQQAGLGEQRPSASMYHMVGL